MKRIISVFLTVVICLSIMPFNALADVITDASAVNSIIEKITDVNVRTKFEEVLSEYPSGSRFSMGYNWESDINSKITTSATQGEAHTCYGFALYVYASVFGLHGGGIYVEHTKDGESDKLLSGALEASYQSFLESGVKAGAHIRTTDDFSSVTNALDGGHSMIVLHYDSDYLYVYHGNADGNGGVRVTQYTWDDFNSKQLKGKSTPRRIKYVAVPKPQYYEGGSVPSIIYPANNATNVPYDFFTLKWTAVANADSYRVSLVDITGGIEGEKPFEDITAEINYVDIPYYALSQNSTYRVYVEAIVDGDIYACEQPYPTFTTCKQPELSINETFIYRGIDKAEFTISSFDNFNSNVLVVADAITDERCLTVDVDNNSTYTLDYSDLEYGEYYAYFTACDGNGMVDSNIVYFTICEGTDVEPENTTYDCGKITIDIDEVTESTYWFSVEGFAFSKNAIIGIADISNNVLEVTATNIVHGNNSFGVAIAPKSCGTATVTFAYSPCDETGTPLTTYYYFTFEVEIVKSNVANEELFDYELLNGGAVITYCDTSASGDIVIPSKLGGYPVTGIGDSAFHECTNITSVTIPDGVTIIWNSAFNSCKNLTSIIIPDSVTTIGSSAFAYCSSLTSIIIPDSVTTIGGSAFVDCSSLTNIILPEGITSIKYGTFSSCTSLTSITIPKSVTSIEETAFFYCKNLTNIIIPENVTSIENSAFAYCSSLESIDLPKGITSIEAFTFGYCSNLINITLPESVTSIGEDAFKNCSSLASITLPKNVTNIGESAFDSCSSLNSIIIPNSVTSIESSTFIRCENLISITIPKSVTSIGSYAFNLCSNLKEVYYSGSEEDWNNIAIDERNDELINSTMHFDYVYDNEEFGESILYNFTVTPESSSAGKNYLFHIEADVLPDNAFLQFDDPDTGEWFDEDYASSSWAFSWRDYIISDGRFVLERDMIINSPGSAENEYKRKVRVIHYTDDGVKRASETISFVVMPKDEETPEITIYDASYIINGNNLIITVLTSPAVEKLKVENNQTTMNIFNSGYVDQNADERLWTITKSLDYYANKSLTLIPGNNEYGYSDSTYELFISYDAPSSMGTLLITSPAGNSLHEKGQDLAVSWRAPMVEPDSYVLTVSCDDGTVHTYYPTNGATSAKISGNNFNESGTYYITLVATKNGYSDAEDMVSVYVAFEDEEIIQPPGEDIGDVKPRVNPEYVQVYNYICNYVKGWDTTTKSSDYLHALFAMVYQESEWQQFEVKNGETVPIKRYNSDSYDVGICQINSMSQNFDKNKELLEENWQFNLETGISRYNYRYWICMDDPEYIAVVEEGMRKTGVSREEAIARSAYSMYQGGVSTSTAKRWFNTPEDADKNYLRKYKNKPWEGKLGDYVDENKTMEDAKPGIINVAMNVYIAVRASASDSSAIIGRFSNGTNISVGIGENDYLYVEGVDYESGKTITGYVKAAYVSYDSNPVLKPTTYVCTVNKAEVYHGDSVTFTVNASPGATDFTITYDNVITENISMNYYGGVYNYEKSMTGTGERNVVISWIEPNGNRVKANATTIAVYLNKNHWDGKYIDGVLILEQTKQIPNDSNEYGLYVKIGDDYKYGDYPVVAAIDDSNCIYERNSDDLLYRTWDNARNLYLDAGTYEYGIVTRTAKGTVCSHTPIGEFKVVKDDTEDYAKYEARYIRDTAGANVYSDYKNSKLTGEVIHLGYGAKVDFQVGSGVGINDRYVKVFYYDEEGKDRVGWISRSSLTTTPVYVHPYPDFEPRCFPVALTYPNITSVYYYDSGSSHASPEYNAIDVGNGGAILGAGAYAIGPALLTIADEGEVTYVYDECTHNVYYKQYSKCTCGEKIDWPGNGNKVKIKYPINDKEYYSVTYIHVAPNSIQFKVGEKIKYAGTKIASMGNTGNSSAAHLHMTVTKVDSSGREIYVNPIDLYAFNRNFVNADSTRKFSVKNNIESLAKTVFGNNYHCYFDEQGNWLNSKCGGNCVHNKSNSLSLFSLDDGATESASYNIDCYDSIEKFDNLSGTNEGEVSLTVPGKTESINIHIPIDETRQFVTIYHRGQGYENNSRFDFDTSTFEFTAIVKDLVGDEEYEFDFVINKEFKSEPAINYATVSYYNSADEYIGGDVIDFDNVTAGNAPYSTAYVEFENPLKKTSTFKIATEADYELGVWLPSSLPHSFTEDSKMFMLSANNDDDNAVAYTINRAEKSSDRNLQNVTVEVYNDIDECFASKTYMVEDGVIKLDLPYSTENIKLYTETTSQFATAEVILNGETLSEEDLISISDLRNVYIRVTAENGESSNYEFDIDLAATEDITAPVISVVGESGTVYSSGSEIRERVIYSATDDSWYDIYLSLNGEVYDEMEGISENGEYTLTAVDVFGNESEFKFTYKSYDYALVIENAEYAGSTVGLSVTTDNTTGTTKNATLFMAAYNSSGKLLALQSDDAFELEPGTVTRDMQFDCSEVKENEIIVKLFVWESGKSIEPIATAIQTAVSKI